MEVLVELLVEVLVEEGAKNTPWVVYDACCSRTVSPASLRMSMGMRECEAANMMFMMGMYWVARSPEVETMRMRLLRRGVCFVDEGSGAGWWEVEVGLEDG